ncbi:MAG: hypothetical protein J6B70_11175, partial [Oscillospiraceae bacterium]|nr:hypothetical protein [Oscillospiraceae bacterium]
MKFASRTGLGYHIIFWKNVKKKIQKHEKTSCRFVNDVLHIRKRIKNIFGSHPVEGSHGESVIASLPDSKLFGEVIEG